MMKKRVGSLPGTLKPIRENKIPVNNALKPETIANLGLRSKSIGNQNVLKDYYNNKQKINNDLSRLRSPVRSSQIQTNVRIVETVKNGSRGNSSDAKRENIRRAYLPSLKYSPPTSPKPRESKSPTGIKGHYYSRSLVAPNTDSQRKIKSTKTSISMSMGSPQLKSYVLNIDTNINSPSASFFSDKTTVSKISNPKKPAGKPKTNVVIKRVANKSVTASPTKTPANRSPKGSPKSSPKNGGRRSPNQSFERSAKHIYGNSMLPKTKKIITTSAGVRVFY